MKRELTGLRNPGFLAAFLHSVLAFLSQPVVFHRRNRKNSSVLVFSYKQGLRLFTTNART